MEYLVYISSSKMYQGQLQVLFDPANSTPTTYATDPTNKLANVMIDLASSSRTVFKVGYSSPSPALQVALMSATSTGTVNTTRWGNLVFYVAAPLTGPIATASVSVYVFQRPSQDMKFFAPSQQIRTYIGGQSIYPLRNLVYNSGVECPEDQCTYVLVDDVDYDVSGVLAGSVIEDVLSLCQRPSLVGFTSLTNVEGDYAGSAILYLPTYPQPPNRASTDVPPFAPVMSTVLPGSAANNLMNSGVQCFNYCGFYAAMFMGQRGSVRWKMGMLTSAQLYLLSSYQILTFNVQPTRVSCSPYTPTYTDMNYWDNGAAFTGQQVLTTDNFIEFLVPIWTGKKWVPAYCGQQSLTGPTMTVNINPTVAATSNIGVDIWGSAGPDYALVGFRYTQVIGFMPIQSA